MNADHQQWNARVLNLQQLYGVLELQMLMASCSVCCAVLCDLVRALQAASAILWLLCMMRPKQTVIIPTNTEFEPAVFKALRRFYASEKSEC